MGWKWRRFELNSLQICPFVSDPSFLCKTHIFVSFVQKNSVIGHSVISLFEMFPQTLVDTKEIKKKYAATNKHLKTMKQAMKNEKQQNIANWSTKNNNKYSTAFCVKISKNGANIGEFCGRLCCDGALIRKHAKYSNVSSKLQSQSVSNEESENESQWACQFCTFLNIANQTNVCQVCGGGKTEKENNNLFIFESELAQLREMGFKEDEQKIKDLLLKNNGNIKSVANILLFKFNQWPL